MNVTSSQQGEAGAHFRPRSVIPKKHSGIEFSVIALSILGGSALALYLPGPAPLCCLCASAIVAGPAFVLLNKVGREAARCL